MWSPSQPLCSVSKRREGRLLQQPSMNQEKSETVQLKCKNKSVQLSEHRMLFWANTTTLLLQNQVGNLCCYLPHQCVYPPCFPGWREAGQSWKDWDFAEFSKWYILIRWKVLACPWCVIEWIRFGRAHKMRGERPNQHAAFGVCRQPLWALN